MKLDGKKWRFGFLFFFCIVIMSFFIVYTIGGGFLIHPLIQNENETVLLEMKVGEKLDLNEYVGGWKDNTVLYGDTNSSLFKSDKVFIDEDGFLHAKEGGLYFFSVANERYLLPEVQTKWKGKFLVVAYDAEYDNYLPVKNYDQLESGVRGGKKKFIQAGNFTISGRNVERLLDFDGMLINPDGYTITIRDDLPLFRQLNESAVVSGLRVNDGGEGFRPMDEELGNVYGMIAAGNVGAVVDCAVQADLYGGEILQEGYYTSVSGIAGSNGKVTGPNTAPFCAAPLRGMRISRTGMRFIIRAGHTALSAKAAGSCAIALYRQTPMSRKGFLPILPLRCIMRPFLTRNRTHMKNSQSRATAFSTSRGNMRWIFPSRSRIPSGKTVSRT